jgi:hypothetical protein
VPARVQDRGDQVIAGKVAVKAGDPARDQVRAAPHEPLQQGLLPGGCPAQYRPEHGAAGPGSYRDDLELRERGGIIRRPGGAEERPVRRGVRQAH